MGQRRIRSKPIVCPNGGLNAYFGFTLSRTIFGLTRDFLSRTRAQTEALALVQSGRQAARCGRGL